MKRFAAVGIVVVSVAMSSAPAFQSSTIGRWKSYTDMRAVRAVQRTAATVWATTGGGAFHYIPSSNTFSQYTNSEGLSTNDVTAATQDAQGRLWFGTNEGFVNRYDPATGLWTEIRGIAESNRVLKTVRTLYAHNDTLFIGTEFGVVVYRMATEEFGDTYANFGFTAQPRVNDIVVHQNLIWVATDSAVAAAPLSLSNLSSPVVWSRYSAGVEPGSNTVTSLAVSRGVVYAGTGGGVSYFQNGAFAELQEFRGKPVVAMEPSTQNGNERLFIVWNGSQSFTVEALVSETSPPELIASNTETQASALASQPATNDLWVGTPKSGIAQWDGTEWSYYAPNGPASNLFSSVAVDEAGVLWAGSGISGQGAGFYRFDPSYPEGERWKNFTTENYPMMAFNDYFKASVGTNGSVWISSWGEGIVEVAGDTIRRRISTPTFATAVSSNPTYVVMGGVATDGSGATWFVNYGAVTNLYLVKLTGDTTFTYYPKSISPFEGRLTAMVVDRLGTKWIANAEPQNKPTTGLVYFNETPDVVSGTSSTNGWGLMSDPILPHNTVLSLAVDLDGDICVGTDAGMLIITNPSNPTQQPFRPPAMLGQTIQAIAVDAVNNKWVGTREGIQVLSPDGVQLLQSYTVASTNGKLLTDDVRSLAIDQQRGILYAGTEKGLSSMEIPAVQASRSFTTLEFGPNPYRIPNADQLVIRNLAENSSIRILSVSGGVVREFPAQGGGRAFWDGRNSEGQYVPTGVYFVVAYSENGNQFTTGKIAVVRR